MPTVPLPGGRDARATLDERGGDAVVVACPPHPRRGGTRHDARLRAVSDALAPRGVDCLRVEYGPWAEGRGERADARAACGWAAARYDRVALFGYSFGGGVALAVAGGGGDAPDDPVPDTARATGESAAPAATPPATRATTAIDAVAALAPPATLPDGTDVAAAVRDAVAPPWVGTGTRDRTVDADAVAEAARERGGTVESVDAGHGFAGKMDAVAERVARFVAP